MIQINPMSTAKAFNLHVVGLLSIEDVRISGNALRFLPGTIRLITLDHHFSTEKLMTEIAVQTQLQLPGEYLTNKSEAQAKALSCIAIRPLRGKLEQLLPTESHQHEEPLSLRERS